MKVPKSCHPEKKILSILAIFEAAVGVDTAETKFNVFLSASLETVTAFWPLAVFLFVLPGRWFGSCFL